MVTGPHHNIIRVVWQNFVGDDIDRIYDAKTFISKYLYFKKGWGRAIFADIIKILSIFIITIYKDSGKVKINRNYVSNTIYICIS